MSIMDKILHIKTNDDKQYDINIYSTKAEVTSPNLKVTVNNTTGYVALGETSNTNATPLKVKHTDNITYAVLSAVQSSITAGSFVLTKGNYFTVPTGVKVILASFNSSANFDDVYIKVNEGSIYKIYYYTSVSEEDGTDGTDELTIYNPNTKTYQTLYSGSISDTDPGYIYYYPTIYYSEDINNHSVDYTANW